MIEYVKESELYELYTDSLTYMKPLWKHFKEYERIGRSQPHPGIAKHLPKVTDGTLASLCYEQPKRYIQQIPTGKVHSDDEWLDILGGYIYEHEILPHEDTQVAELIQKCWALGTKALWYGSQPALVKMIQHNGKTFPTFDLPYIKDVFLEPGKKSDKDSNVICVRSWYQPRDIQYIIDSRSAQAKRYKDKFNETLDEEWDLKALAEVKKKVTSKSEDSKTPNDRDKGTESTGIELIHIFQRGVGGTFYTYSPDIKKVVRRKTNKDPRGAIPVHFMYANFDFSNPLGRGAIEQSGGKQNLLDTEMQAYQWNRLLDMDGPKKIIGTGVITSSLSMKPGAKWRMGPSGGDVQMVELSTSAIENFANNYGLIKSQILNENSSTDTSISSEAGNPGFGKTPQALRGQEQKLGVSDNYMRKQFESCFGEIAETELNMWFGEKRGVQELQLDEATAAKIRQLNPGAVNEERKVRIDYDAEATKLDFKVDPSTSSLKDDAAERDRLVELLDLSGKYEIIGSIIGQQGMKELVNRIVVKSGVEDPEKIMPSKADGKVGPDGQPVADGQQDAAQDQNDVTPEMVQQMIAQALQQHDQQKPEKPIHESLGIKFEMLPEDVQQKLIAQIFQIQSQSPTPTAIDKNLKAAELDQKQQSIDHNKFDIVARHANAQDAQDLAYHNADHQNQLAIQSHIQSAQQAQQSHELQAAQAAQQAQQPQSTGAAA